MTFKEFLQNEGLFGLVSKNNPIVTPHQVEKRLMTHPTNLRGSSVKRMLSSGPKINTVPKPSGIISAGRQTTLSPEKNRPKKANVKSPLGIS